MWEFIYRKAQQITLIYKRHCYVTTTFENKFATENHKLNPHDMSIAVPATQMDQPTRRGSCSAGEMWQVMFVWDLLPPAAAAAATAETDPCATVFLCVRVIYNFIH